MRNKCTTARSNFAIMRDRVAFKRNKGTIARNKVAVAIVT